MKVSFIASKTVLRSITCPGQFFWLCAQIIIIIIIIIIIFAQMGPLSCHGLEESQWPGT